MNRLSPAFVGLCFLLGACSGQGNEDNTDGTPEPTAGSGGMVAVGGELPAVGGTPEAGGAPSIAGGGSGGEAIAGGGSGGTEPTLGGTGGASGGMGGGAGAAGTGGKAPIDFSIWQLQLPTGSGSSPDTISPAKLAMDYSSAYFKKVDDGGYAFMDPAKGVTTSGSDHPRSELRESNANGGEATWTSTGTNIMNVSGKVTLMSGGTKGSTTVAQVFVADSNTLCELQYNGSQFKVFYEESKGNGQGPDTLAGTFPINTKYTFTLSLSKGVLDVSINDKVLWTKKPSSAVSGKKFYFKVGNYDQTSSAGTPNTTPYTVVEAYTVDVEHS
jgi:hypothetical protein